VLQTVCEAFVLAVTGTAAAAAVPEAVAGVTTAPGTVEPEVVSEVVVPAAVGEPLLPPR